MLSSFIKRHSQPAIQRRCQDNKLIKRSLPSANRCRSCILEYRTPDCRKRRIVIPAKPGAEFKKNASSEQENQIDEQSEVYACLIRYVKSACMRKISENNT